MRDYTVSPESNHSNPSSFWLHHRKAGLTLAGIFVTAGVVAGVGVQAQSGESGAAPRQSTLHCSAASNTTNSQNDGQSANTSGSSPNENSANSSNTTTVHTSKTGSGNVQLTVNGQTIPVPNGTTERQVPAQGSGSNASVHVTSNANSSAAASSSLNVQITSNTSGSSTIVSQSENTSATPSSP